ncbi:MAG: hypothetical protein K6G01_04635 [Eubacterium sp.]|nr:hypothetical protein [Eubacterium sp.]
MDEKYKNRALRAKTIKKFIEQIQEGKETDSRSYDKLWLFVNHEYAPQRMGELEPGQSLVLIGQIGRAASTYLAEQCGDELRSRIHPRVVALGREDIRVELPEGLDAKGVYPVAEGGLFAALNQLARDYGRGFFVEASKVLVRQETIEFSEYYDLHPWELLSGNCYVVVTEDAGSVMEACHKRQIKCSRIGHLTNDNRKVIAHAGEESLLNRARPDALLTVLKKDLQ